MLCMIVGTNFMCLPQQLGCHSVQCDVSDFSNPRLGADWLYYDPYWQKATDKHMFEVLRNSLRPVRSVRFPSRIHHKVSPPSGDVREESNCDSSKGCIRNEVTAAIMFINAEGAKKHTLTAHADALEIALSDSLRVLWSFEESWSMLVYARLVYWVVSSICADFFSVDYGCRVHFAA